MYVGFTVLELSRTLMYDFHYDFIKKKNDSKAKLLYSDTDSFIYEIETKDFYDDMKKELDRFDTSNFARDKSTK